MKRPKNKFSSSKGREASRGKEPPFWLVLDVHGVLIPSSERWILKKLATRTHQSMVGIYLRWFLNLQSAQLGKESALSFYEKVLDRKLTPKQFREWYIREYAARGSISPSLLRELVRLKKSGWRLAILSDMHSAQAEFHRAHHHFSLFDEVFLSCETGMMKPFPDVFTSLEKRLRTRKDHVVFCDDLWFNAGIASLLGWRALTIKGPAQLEHFLRDLR